MQGTIDYSLAKRSVLRDFRRGLLGRHDLCDAHPELMRAARNIGKPLARPCPVCSRDHLRQVAYVYGDELRHLSGRVAYPDGWVGELSQTHEEFRCYCIEVCVSCSWNHLDFCYLMGRRFMGEAPGAEASSE